MNWKERQREITLRILLRQNRLALSLVAGWFLLALVVLMASGLPPMQALRILVFLEGPGTTPYAFFYQSMTDIVVVGLVMSILLVDMQRQVQPEVTSRIMAQELTDHAVVIESSHLGKRVFQVLSEHGIPVAMIDPDPEHLEDLVREGFPTVIGDGRNDADLEAVNVAGAKLVVFAGDDLETTAVVCSKVRRMNPDCQLIVRCYEDAIGEILGRRYRAQIVSTSKLAAGFIKDYASKHKVQKVVLVGCGTIGRRVLPVLRNLNCRFTMLVSDPVEVADLADEATILVGRTGDPDLLAQAGIRDADMVVLTEDDLGSSLITADRVRHVNTGCRILCRVYHDDAADMLGNPPFKCDVISTSRYAVDKLRGQGAFQCVGLGAPAPRKTTGRTPEPVPAAEKAGSSTA